MDEKFWKKLEELIAKIPNWAIQSAGTETLDDGAHGFAIHLRKLYDKNDYEVEVEEVKAEPLRCKLGFHKWSKWSIEEVNLHNLMGVFQMRECIKCGEIMRRSTLEG